MKVVLFGSVKYCLPLKILPAARASGICMNVLVKTCTWRKQWPETSASYSQLLEGALTLGRIPAPPAPADSTWHWRQGTALTG